MAARVLTVSLISLAQMLVLVLAVYDGALSPLALTAGLASAAFMSALFGFVLIAFYDDLYAFLLPMIGAIMLLGAPGYAVLLGIAPAWLVWHPTASALALIEIAFDLDSAEGLVTSSVSAVLWTVAAATLAYMAILRKQARVGGA